MESFRKSGITFINFKVRVTTTPIDKKPAIFLTIGWLNLERFNLLPQNNKINTEIDKRAIKILCIIDYCLFVTVSVIVSTESSLTTTFSTFFFCGTVVTTGTSSKCLLLHSINMVS